MPTKDELIWENRELTAKLALAEKWMRREVQSAIVVVWKWGIQKNTRKHFENIFAEEGVEIITRRILDTFGPILDHAPRYTLERLIDAEIYYETLQRYPHMDGLPIILAYQKILDAWIEERLIVPWRASQKSQRHIISWENSLEKDFMHIISKNYTLSIGRFFQTLTLVREQSVLSPLVLDFTAFIEQKYPKVLTRFTEDIFFLPFSRLMEREIFSKKRHEKKVSYSDVGEAREILYGDDTHIGILKNIFASA